MQQFECDLLQRFFTLLCSSLLNSLRLYSTLLASTQLFSAALLNSSRLLYSTLLGCSTRLYILKSSQIYPALLDITRLYSTLLLYSALLCSVLLYSTPLYCALLYSSLSSTLLHSVLPCYFSQLDLNLRFLSYPLLQEHAKWVERFPSQFSTSDTRCLLPAEI